MAAGVGLADALPRRVPCGSRTDADGAPLRVSLRRAGWEPGWGDGTEAYRLLGLMT